MSYYKKPIIKTPNPYFDQNITDFQFPPTKCLLFLKRTKSVICLLDGFYVNGLTIVNWSSLYSNAGSLQHLVDITCSCFIIAWAVSESIFDKMFDPLGPCFDNAGSVI